MTLLDPAARSWPDGLLDRVKSALRRVQDGHSPRRIPADVTDVDMVLAEVRDLIEGRWPPFWIKDAIPAARVEPIPGGVAEISERERHLAEKAVEGNAWRLAALRVGANKFPQLPPVGYYDWSPQEWCDWVMAQPIAAVSLPSSTPGLDPKGGWIPVTERMPEPDTECIVWSPGNAQHGPYAYLDTWREQHECPVSFSTVSVPIGLGWDSSDYDEISHWMPLPTAPTEEQQ